MNTPRYSPVRSAQALEILDGLDDALVRPSEPLILVRETSGQVHVWFAGQVHHGLSVRDALAQFLQSHPESLERGTY